MIPEYNKIDFEKDTLDVINAKIQVLKQAVQSGCLSQEEYLAEKERVLREYDAYKNTPNKLGYAFNW